MFIMCFIFLILIFPKYIISSKLNLSDISDEEIVQISFYSNENYNNENEYNKSRKINKIFTSNSTRHLRHLDNDNLRLLGNMTNTPTDQTIASNKISNSRIITAFMVWGFICFWGINFIVAYTLIVWHKLWYESNIIY